MYEAHKHIAQRKTQIKNSKQSQNTRKIRSVLKTALFLCDKMTEFGTLNWDINILTTKNQLLLSNWADCSEIRNVTCEFQYHFVNSFQKELFVPHIQDLSGTSSTWEVPHQRIWNMKQALFVRRANQWSQTFGWLEICYWKDLLNWRHTWLLSNHGLAI